MDDYDDYDDYYDDDDDDDDDDSGGDDVETLHDGKAAIFDDYRGKQYRRQRTRRGHSIIGSVHDVVVLLSLLKYRGAHTTTHNIIYARVYILDIYCTGCHRVIVTVRSTI